MATETKRWRVITEDYVGYLVGPEIRLQLTAYPARSEMARWHELADYLDALEACAALLAECDWNYNEYGEYSEDVQAAIDRLNALRHDS